MDENKGLLQAAFEKTDTISYGPFMITKKPGAPWKHAHAFVNQQEVFLPPLKKQYLALLISQQGDAVTIDLFAREIPDSNTSLWYTKSKELDNHVEKRAARNEVINTVKVTVSQLKRDLKQQNIPETVLDTIKTASIRRTLGQTGPYIEGMAGAYSIHLPASP
jgi:hypothetical protein